ncbi:MAG: patatin-like phospholipase RssA [Candidatus Dadabacteria bacterium]|nr:MAG: patatin-like phospholipase RssA [Candidatus Dadabacteria bacterium]
MSNLRIGLALGSGSARGWAHLGVIRELERRGIRPDVVAGTSIGALVGAAYAMGKARALEAWVRRLTRWDVIRFLDVKLLGGGLIEGERLRDFFLQHVPDTPIETLPIPYAAVATDLRTGREVWFREGSVAEAVRASVAVPGLFTPARVGQSWYVDGGLTNPVPVAVCRALGADVVIAVDLNTDLVARNFKPEREEGLLGGGPVADWVRQAAARLPEAVRDRAGQMLASVFGEKDDRPGLVETVVASVNIMQARITRSRMAGDPPEVLITPRLGHIGLMEFERGEEAVREGREAVVRAAEALEFLKG